MQTSRINYKMVNTAPIENPSILIKPSKQLASYAKKIKLNACNNNLTELKHLVTSEDRAYIKELNLEKTDHTKALPLKNTVNKHSGELLNLNQLHEIYEHIKKDNETNMKKVYFHEIFEGSEIILPENIIVPRNKELDARCQRLKAQQENLEYSTMTKNVDCVRKKHPEDTLSFQLQQMNRHLIAVFQFIVSVLAGFAFGFIGVELIIGKLDFGFRLLLGIICALIIALAELYFLAKKLNEDLQFEVQANLISKKVK